MCFVDSDGGRQYFIHFWVYIPANRIWLFISQKGVRCHPSTPTVGLIFINRIWEIASFHISVCLAIFDLNVAQTNCFRRVLLVVCTRDHWLSCPTNVFAILMRVPCLTKGCYSVDLHWFRPNWSNVMGFMICHIYLWWQARYFLFNICIMLIHHVLLLAICYCTCFVVCELCLHILYRVTIVLTHARTVYCCQRCAMTSVDRSIPQ